MTLIELDAAAFWDQKVCLACGELNEPDAELCAVCGSDEIVPAELAAKCARLVEDSE